MLSFLNTTWYKGCFSLQNRLPTWLRTHWAIIPLVLMAIPLIFYNLGYESYWQDELTSYDVAKAILAHGLPTLLSGFLYPKGELYSYLLFLPTANNPSITGTWITGTNTFITVNSVLAVIGCLLARRSTEPCIRYCALFLVISFFTLVFIFTMQADRYFYPLLPIYYLMGAYALLSMLRTIEAFAHCRVSPPQFRRIMLPEAARAGYFSRPMKILMACTASLACLCVLILPMLPLNGYNLFVSQLFGLSYYQHYADYDAAGQYVQEHRQKGDIAISVIPDIIVSHYVGQSDYFFSIDHALFLFERDGHVVDTYSGQIALLNQADFQAVLVARS